MKKPLINGMDRREATLAAMDIICGMIEIQGARKAARMFAGLDDATVEKLYRAASAYMTENLGRDEKPCTIGNKAQPN